MCSAYVQLLLVALARSVVGARALVKVVCFTASPRCGVTHSFNERASFRRASQAKQRTASSTAANSCLIILTTTVFNVDR